MFWKYSIKRVLNGIIIFVILIFIYSILFNAQLERTIYSQIDEQVNGELHNLNTSRMAPEAIENWILQRKETLYKSYNLDKTSFERIVMRAYDTITFNFGKSTIIKSNSGKRDVRSIVFEAIPRTLLLFVTAMLIDVFLGILLGIKKAQKPGSVLDKSTSIGTMIVYGMPSWWLGMLMIMMFVYAFGIFPSGGLHSTPVPQGEFAKFVDLMWHLALPVITLVILGFWGRAYLTRNIVLSTLQEDYIMAARARGIKERRVLYSHGLRSAAPPLVTMSLLALLASVGGNIIFEGIFSWPGMGNLYWIAVQQNDIPVLMANLAVTTGLYQLGLVILDLTYGLLDPRIKVGGRA